MATYVLVHGAWNGAHGFHRVRALLQDAGHRVFTPSLTGLGERAHLTGPGVGLTTHIRDVVNHVLYEDLNDIVLLGFSYGGFVVAGAVEHLAPRIRHLVFLDAFVPEDGQSVFSLTGTATSTIGLGEPWLVPPPVREFDDPAEAAFMTTRRTSHPVLCFSEAVRLPRPLEEHSFGRTYIRATAEPVESAATAAFEAAARRAQASPHWHSREIGTNHMIANNRPEELAGLLRELA